MWPLDYSLLTSAMYLFTCTTVFLREISLPTHDTVNSREKIYILREPCVSRKIGKIMKLAFFVYLYYLSGLCKPLYLDHQAYRISTIPSNYINLWSDDGYQCGQKSELLGTVSSLFFLPTSKPSLKSYGFRL